MTKIILASAVMYGLASYKTIPKHSTPECTRVAVLGGIIYPIAILSLRVVDVKELKQQF